MTKPASTRWRPSRSVIIVIVAAVLAAGGALLGVFVSGGQKSHSAGSSSPSGSPPSPAGSLPTSPPAPASFAYGFDLTTQEPEGTKGNNSDAVASALGVLRGLPGVYVDQSIDGFGVGNPEPEPGVYQLNDLANRISLITSAGDVPVITLVSAPNWMKDGATSGSGLFDSPPSPDHYADFATLCAHVAQSFPQVKYFVVWSELRGFFDHQSNSWDYKDYTAMYNDVYRAIKAVRPDASVGGPYAVMTTSATPVSGKVSTVRGRFGYLDQGMLDAMTYWLAHKTGADFVAVDGATEVAKSDDPNLADPVEAAGQYAAVDEWIRGQTDLPIWWMESHIQPAHGWSAKQAAAARIATLSMMASSGASVGMQWQPQGQASWPDEGLWTSTLSAGGGQPTPLDRDLALALPVLEHHPVQLGGQPAGVVAVADSAGTLLVDTSKASLNATASGRSVSLQPGQVLVLPA